ncbi:uncharacterized protein LOC113202040 [Frankliniella occidentalis]|uniref:Uncharacterized protein LOC113202040 n=1 Tax=Frankliniella occidentalis TaxID=133901 RepID=A0A9C6X9I4_FRAOC|nr:uncharacterized protein LOC113202040 [Frankliniella occidentalis]
MEAPVATLVVAGVLLLASAVQITASATTSSATVTTTTPTTAARPSATGLEFCDVPQPLHLVAGSQKSSTRLRLSPPLLQRPCRLEVTAPASNDLRLELVPVVPVVEADATPDAQEIPDENDDAYDRHRLALYEFRDALAARDRKEDDSRAAHRRGAAITNPGMEAVSLVRQDAERRGSTANASCNLALYVQGEVAWAVDLCDPKAIADANHPDSAFAKMPGPLTLVWTPPRPGLALRAAALSITAVRKEVPADNACTVGAVKLAGRGLESAMALELLDRRAPEDRAEPCRVTVEAPSSYLLSLLLVKVAAEADSSSSYYSSSAVSNESDGDLVEDEENAATEDAAAATTRPTCGLKVILGCSTELWTVDLCDPAEAAALNTTELFPNNVTLVWTSPTPTVQRGSQRTPQTTPQFAATVILTAIGRGIPRNQTWT